MHRYYEIRAGVCYSDFIAEYLNDGQQFIKNESEFKWCC